MKYIITEPSSSQTYQVLPDRTVKTDRQSRPIVDPLVPRYNQSLRIKKEVNRKGTPNPKKEKTEPKIKVTDPIFVEV